MNTKPFFATLALTAALAVPSFAQETMKTKSDTDKTKTKADGMTTKTKMSDDGKMKVKGKSEAGDKMKSKTKPREDMKMKDGSMGTATSGGVMVGGAMMTANKDIVDNAAASADHTTLVAAVKAAGLVETLKSAGPFTVFAPTNAAFDKLPAGTVASLLTPEMKPTLTKILTYHVVAGRMTSADLKKAIKAGKGKATLKTVSGGTLTAMMKGSKAIELKDEKGGISTVTIADVMQSNGVIHVVNTVLMPK